MKFYFKQIAMSKWDCLLLPASLSHNSTLTLTSVRREAEAAAMHVLKKGLITEAGERKQKKLYELLGYLCQKSFTLWEFMEFTSNCTL